MCVFMIIYERERECMEKRVSAYVLLCVFMREYVCMCDREYGILIMCGGIE